MSRLTDLLEGRGISVDGDDATAGVVLSTEEMAAWEEERAELLRQIAALELRCSVLEEDMGLIASDRDAAALGLSEAQVRLHPLFVIFPYGHPFR